MEDEKIDKPTHNETNVIEQSDQLTQQTDTDKPPKDEAGEMPESEDDHQENEQKQQKEETSSDDEKVSSTERRSRIHIGDFIKNNTTLNLEENNTTLNLKESYHQKMVYEVRDPSQPFEPIKPNSQIQPSFQNIEARASEYAHLLKEQGILIISCAHEVLLYTATLNILDNYSFKSFDRRTIDLDLDDEEISLKTLVDASRLLSIGETAPRKNDGGRNSIVVIDLCENSSLTKFERYSRRLTRNRFWITSGVYYLFRISGVALTAVNDINLLAEFPRWHINALNEILEGFSDRGDRKIIQDNLDKSRKAGEGLWPIDESDFLYDVEKILSQGGLEVLKKEIENRHNAQADQRPPAVAKELLRKANVAEKIVLFTAVFFPECTIHQFSKIINELFEGESLDEKYQEDSIQPSTGQCITLDKKRKVAAKNWWETNQENAMERLYLEYTVLPEGKTIIGFVQRTLKDGIRVAFPPPLMIQFFDKLHATNLLLDPKTHKTIIDSLVALTTEMSLRYRDAYNETWLMKRLDELMSRIGEYARQAGHVLSKIDSDSATFGALLQLLEKEWRSYHSQLISRLSSLCRGFLDKSRSAQITHAFLDQLILRTQPSGMTVLRIIRHLRGALGYNYLPRLQHLLNVGDIETCQHVTLTLLEEMRESPEMYWKILQDVAEWHPPKDSMQEKKPLSSSQYWSLAFLYFSFIAMRDQYEQLRIRKIEIPVTPLFVELDETPPLDEQFTLIASWIGHPAFYQGLSIVLKKYSIDLYNNMNSWAGEACVGEFCTAEMLEFWTWELNDDAVLKMTPLLAQHLQKSSLIHIRILVREQVAFLTDEAISKTLNSDKRKELSKRRKKADALYRSLIRP